MRVVSKVGLFLAVWSLACNEKPTFEFHVGMSQSELVQRYGPPDTTQRMVKHDEAIWGAIETYWSRRLDSGDAVTIWFYPTSIGTWELYFRDDDTLLDGMGFSPEGVVY